MSRPTLTVSQLNEYVRLTLAGDPMLHGVTLRGELSNFKRNVTGHCYFTLKDESASISCAMFRSAAMGLDFRPSDGQQVLVYGSVGLYAQAGRYQLYVDTMEQDGVGDLYRRFEALKAKLTAEGLFDSSLKKPLPMLPKGVGVITSKTGAVIHDICRVAWRRNPSMPIYLYPVAVQGDAAATEIANAIRAMDRFAEVDVLIVGRGGGSMEDLWSFNEEAVARAISRCKKPVVSAVGHETDFTIADFVADVRAATPSAAAELIVAEREALARTVDRLQSDMRQACLQALNMRETALTKLESRIRQCTPERLLTRYEDRRAHAEKRLRLLTASSLMAAGHRLQEAELRLNAASPQATLARGYAMLQQDGGVVQSVHAVKLERPLTIYLRDGRIQATPQSKEER